jgi:hypothetical protein
MSVCARSVGNEQRCELDAGLARFGFEPRPDPPEARAVLPRQHLGDVGPLGRRVGIEQERSVVYVDRLLQRRQHTFESLVAEQAPGTHHVHENVDRKRFHHLDPGRARGRPRPMLI